MLQKASPAAADVLMKKATASTTSKFEYYQKLAALSYEEKGTK
jgi:hypothetical protein